MGQGIVATLEETAGQRAAGQPVRHGRPLPARRWDVVPTPPAPVLGRVYYSRNAGPPRGRGARWWSRDRSVPTLQPARGRPGRVARTRASTFEVVALAIVWRVMLGAAGALLASTLWIMWVPTPVIPAVGVTFLTLHSVTSLCVTHTGKFRASSPRNTRRRGLFLFEVTRRPRAPRRALP